MIAVCGLTLEQGQFAIRDVNFSIPTGQYGVLMGPTGSGKSSILEVIAGLRSASVGNIILGERDVTTLPPNERDVGYVPQDGALFRTMTVYQHLALGLWLRKQPQRMIDDHVRELAEWLGISHLLTRRPLGLSGGEAQRVALGRALSYKPAFLLLDEPLSALDEKTREAMLNLLEQLRQARATTVLHVTHQSAEAERLGDVVLRMAQWGT